MMRLSTSRFSTLGNLQSRAVEVAGESATVDATRTFAAADRVAAIVGVGGYITGRSYAVPDVSGGVVVIFEEVYPI